MRLTQERRMPRLPSSSTSLMPVPKLGESGRLAFATPCHRTSTKSAAVPPLGIGHESRTRPCDVLTSSSERCAVAWPPRAATGVRRVLWPNSLEAFVADDRHHSQRSERIGPPPPE